MQSQVTTHRTTGHQLLLLTATLLAMDVMVREVLSQDIFPMDMDLLLMVMDLVVSAPELVFTKLVQFTSPDLLRVLVSVVLMLSQDILVLAMVMAMVLVVSVQVLDCILLEQFMSPGLPKVSVAD